MLVKRNVIDEKESQIEFEWNKKKKKQKINQLYYLNRFKNSFERTDKKEFIKHDK